MSILTLVRHGQALPFQSDGDKLSAIGRQQAERLGEFWLEYGITYDEVYTGPLNRQRMTAEIVGNRINAGGSRWPEASVAEEWAEYDATGILSKLSPDLAERDAGFKKLVEDHEKNVEGKDRNRYFQRMFEVVVSAWLAGEVESSEVEPWSLFQERIGKAVKRILEAGATGRRVVVFTSGGPIGVTIQRALSAPPRNAVELNWRIRNCSVTDFIFTQNRLSLDSFNVVSHLEPALITYR
jgi:broad specificity phosphatase PhoE